MSTELWIDVILIALVVFVSGQNFGIRERLKRIEGQLARRT